MLCPQQEHRGGKVGEGQGSDTRPEHVVICMEGDTIHVLELLLLEGKLGCRMMAYAEKGWGEWGIKYEATNNCQRGNSG